MDEVVWV
jgi:hypothetical protein